MNKKLILISILVFLLILPVCTVKAGENFSVANNYEKERVLVGWYERDGYFERNADGSFSGLGYDYLKAIASYTGWEYEFVEGTRAECMTWLARGQIDLMSPINENQELPAIKLATEMIGEDYGYLYKKNNNHSLKYEDFSNFNKATVGVINYADLENGLKKYYREHDFEFYKVETYETMEELKTAMANGEIDLILTDSYVNVENMKVVGRFSNHRITFASKKDKIIRQINWAMGRMQLNNPEFILDLRETHFSEGSQNNLEYTMEEVTFLEKDRFLNVSLSKNQYPVSYRVNNDNSYKGIAIELLERIQYQTGLEFHIFYEDTYRQAKEKMDNNKENIHVLAGGIISKQQISAFRGEAVGIGTDKRKYNVSFYDVRLGIVGGKDKDPENRLTAAIPEYVAVSLSTLREIYPHYEFKVYENGEQCMRAVLNKNADVAIFTDVGIQELMVYDIYKDMQVLQYVPGNFVSVFTILTEDKVLVDIFNKALQNIPTEVKQTIVNDNIYHLAMRTVGIEELWQQYRDFIIIAAAIVAGILVYRKYLREKKAKEKAYNDGVADVSTLEKLKLDMTPILETKDKEHYYVIAIDIDKFKVINDLYGYHMGDKTIAFLGKILKDGLTAKDFIARSTADNFVIIKKSKSAEKIQDYLNHSYQLLDDIIAEKEVHYRLILKAGIYKISERDKNLSSIIDKAHLAKHNIQQIFESSYMFYNEKMRKKNIEEKRLENAMEKALKKGEFCIYLQPQIDMKTEKIVSAEALIRWNSEEKGMISPATFIPVFERNGFITKLDLFVWEEAIRTLHKWQEKHMKMVPIAINLSRIDIQTEGMLEQLVEMMHKYQMDARWIKTELTESVCLESDSVIMEKMNLLNSMGFKIAIDDFGAGYSSFYLLKEMPIHILKIDKSFLEFDVRSQAKHLVVLSDVINLGKHLDLQIVMEGVETKDQVDLLKYIGCDIAQGYYYSKPVTVEEFERLLERDYGTKGARV
ncbi:MAG: EAL domain-containing protein [Lachnospiraceae bacterium]|nr:EAL domain-containing protein [Lachnospiraceae bacterium]